MDKLDEVSKVGEKDASGPESGPAQVVVRAGIRWRSDLLAGLVAGAAFALLTAMADMFGAGLIWLACMVFLPIGIWVGRRSQRPWGDGTAYSLAATVLVVLLLLARLFPLGAFLSLFMVLPQGIIGTWVGARLWPAAAIRSLQGRHAEGSTPPPTPPEA